MKTIVATAFLLTALCTYTIVQGDSIQDEVRITVTADQKTRFDMLDNSQGVLKGLTTPYEMKFDRTDSHFIFKSLKSESNLKIKVEVNNKTVVTANWPIAVLLITDGTFTTFGME